MLPFNLISFQRENSFFLCIKWAINNRMLSELRLFRLLWITVCNLIIFISGLSIYIYKSNKSCIAYWKHGVPQMIWKHVTQFNELHKCQCPGQSDLLCHSKISCCKRRLSVKLALTLRSLYYVYSITNSLLISHWSTYFTNVLRIWAAIKVAPEFIIFWFVESFCFY